MLFCVVVVASPRCRCVSSKHRAKKSRHAHWLLDTSSKPQHVFRPVTENMVAFSQFASLSSGATTLVELKSDYGYVVFTGIASGFLLTWQALQVGKMRKKFKIYYPIMYSTETTGDGQLFNCYQRAHQNTLETYPIFLMLLFVGGLQYPIPTAMGGALWIASRIAYSLGYYTGNPKNRMRGSFGYLGLFVLVGTTGLFGAKLLGCY